MKFKNWVSITLMIISSVFMLLVFMESFKFNYIGLIGTLICTLLLTKYSKLCDQERWCYILIAKQIRLKPSTIQWINKLAKKEGLNFSAMLRTILEREEYADFIKEQFNNKKRGK